MEPLTQPPLTLPTFLKLFALLLTIYILFTIIRGYLRLRGFPGPLLASFTYLWLASNSLSGRAARNIEALRRKYPNAPFIRIAPDILIFSSPAIHRAINASARKAFNRTNWNKAMRFNPFLDSMFSTTDPAYHDDVKARTAPGYTGREVPGLERDLDDVLAMLVESVRKNYCSKKGETRRVDFKPVPAYFALDVLSRVAYGKEFGYLREDRDVNGWIELSYKMMPLMVFASDIEWFGKMLLAMLRAIGPRPGHSSALGVMMGLAQKLVKQRFEPGAKEVDDMLGSFIRHGLTEQQCEVEVLLQISAGADTTAIVTRYIVLFLASTPHVYSRLQREIDEGIKDSIVSSPITNAEAKALPYLQAVIYETMRYHPPAASLMPKLVPPEGATLEGQFIPGGTRLAWNVTGMLQHVETFGEDVDVFRPERWIEAEPEKKRAMEKVLEQIFGAGRYMCAGKMVAQMELNKVVVELMRHFDFQLLYPDRGWTEKQYLFSEVDAMWMRISERAES